MPNAPSPPQTALQAAAGLIASGRAQEAARELNALVRAAPTYAAAYVLLAKAREASGDRVRALDAWHRAYFLVPSSPLVRRERQRLLDQLAPPPAAALPLAPADDETPLVPEAKDTIPSEPPPIPDWKASSEPPPEAPAEETREQESEPSPEAADESTPGASAETPETEPFSLEGDFESDWADLDPEADLLPPVIEIDDDGVSEGDLEGLDEGWTIVHAHDEPAPPPPAPLPTDVVAPEAESSEAFGESRSREGEDESSLTDAVELPDDASLDNDLDALIRDLEGAPRIKPDPEFDGPDIIADEGSVEEMASETLAQIYAAQQQYAEAAVVYEKLARQKPDPRLREGPLRRVVDRLGVRAGRDLGHDAAEARVQVGLRQHD